MFTRSVSSGQSLSLRPFLKIHFSFRNRVLKLKHGPFKIRSGTETREKISETGSRLQNFCVREPNTEISQGQGEAPRGPVRGAGGARKEEDHEWPRGVG